MDTSDRSRGRGPGLGRPAHAARPERGPAGLQPILL